MTKQITISDLLKMFLNHIRLIIIVTLVATLLAFLYVSFFVTPIYSTTALILVQSEASFTTGSTSSNLNAEEVKVNSITSSIELANTCAVLFTEVPEMKSIISGASVSIKPVEDSYFLRITASSPDPNTAANIANRVAQAAPSVFQTYFGDAGKVDTVDEASIPSRPSSPNKTKYVLIGFLAGLIISLVISFLLEIIDTTIKPGDDLYKIYDVPVFAEIIDFEVEGGGKRK
ncbi:MAG: hypothetical protein IJJ15_03910 [Ruminococcus sp.]|nr:hypothetical protein [Ruminococcus sp.]